MSASGYQWQLISFPSGRFLISELLKAIATILLEMIHSHLNYCTLPGYFKIERGLDSSKDKSHKNLEHTEKKKEEIYNVAVGFKETVV